MFKGWPTDFTFISSYILFKYNNLMTNVFKKDLWSFFLVHSILSIILFLPFLCFSWDPRVLFISVLYLIVGIFTSLTIWLQLWREWDHVINKTSRERPPPFCAVTSRVSFCVSLQWINLSAEAESWRAREALFSIIRFRLCRMSNTIQLTSTKYPATFVSAFLPLNLMLLKAPEGPRRL